MRRLWGKYSYQAALEKAVYWNNKLVYTQPKRDTNDPEMIRQAKQSYETFHRNLVLGINAITSWLDGPDTVTIEDIKKLTNDHNDVIKLWSFREERKVTLVINGKKYRAMLNPQKNEKSFLK